MNSSSRTGLRLQLMREQSLIDQHKNCAGVISTSKESFGSLSPSSSIDATTASSSPAMRVSTGNTVIVGSNGSGGNVKTSPIIISQPIRFTGNRLVHLPPQIIHVQQQHQGQDSEGMGRRNVVLSSSLPPGLPQNTPPKGALYARSQRVNNQQQRVIGHQHHKQSFTKQSPAELSPLGPGTCESPQSASFTSAQSELDDIIIDEILSMEEERQMENDPTSGKMPNCMSYGDGFVVGGRLAYSRQVSSSAPTSSIDIEGLVRDELTQEHEIIRDRRKKDIHNMIERRRRYNINDRIKELGTLLPKGCTEEMKLNKGTILRASVEYIRALRRDQDRLYQLVQRYQNMEQDNKQLTLRIRDLEDHLNSHGLPVPSSFVSNTSGGGNCTQLDRTIKTEPPDEGHSQSVLPQAAPYYETGLDEEKNYSTDYDPAMDGGHSYAISDSQFASLYASAVGEEDPTMTDILETPPVVTQKDLGPFGRPQTEDDKRHHQLNDLIMDLGSTGIPSTTALVSSSDPLMSDSRLINSQVASPEVQWEAQSFSPEGEQMDFTGQ